MQAPPKSARVSARSPRLPARAGLFRKVLVRVAGTRQGQPVKEDQSVVVVRRGTVELTGVVAHPAPAHER